MTCGTMAGLLKHTCTVVHVTATGARASRGRKVESKTPETGIKCFLSPIRARDRFTNADTAIATHLLVLGADQTIDENDEIESLVDENSNALVSHANIDGVERPPGAVGISHIECTLTEVKGGTNT